MSQPVEPKDGVATNYQTLDQASESPVAAPPFGGRPTEHRADTSIKSANVQADVQTGEFATDASAQTGVHTTASAQADASSVTGGYTPADQRRQVAGVPTVRGYEILGELGRGGMGVVYKARQMGLERLVALKMILAGAHARQKDLERFRAEAQAVARFQHPNIVQIYEVGESDGLPFFSLEFVDGGTLSGKIAREPQPPKYAAETMEAIARAMQYAHDRDVVHRDLKPANILVAMDGTPKVTDFGLAKRLEQDSGQTQQGTVLGTPSYMAPEQAMGDTENVGPLADVYALGAMLYDLLTGRPPFSGSSVLDTLEMVRTREPVPPGQLTAKLPRDLETICLKCLQKDASKRYASAGAMADDLRRYLDGKPILARPVSAIERTWRWARRNPWVAGLGTATALLIVAVAIITSIMSYRLNVKKNEAEENFKAATLAKEKEAIERKKADAEKVVREEQGILALNALRGTSIYVDNIMKQKQSLGQMRLQIQEVTLRDLEKISKHMADHPLEGRTEAGALQRIGEVYFIANKVQEAHKEYLKAESVLIRFMTNSPNDPVGPRNLAAVTNTLGDVELRLGETMKARDRYAKGLVLRQQWETMLAASDKDEDKKGVPVATLTIAESHDLLGRAYLELGDPVEAYKSFRESDAIYGRLPPIGNSNEQLKHRRDRLEVQDQIAECLYRLGQSAAAEKAHRVVLEEREALLKTHPHPGYNLKSDVAFSHLRLGDLYLFDQKDAGRALMHYQPLYEVSQERAEADADDLTAKRQLSSLQYRVAVTIGRLADALPLTSATALKEMANAQFAECLKLRTQLAAADKKDTRGQIDVLVVLGRLGRSADAEKVAVGLLAQAPNDRRILFQTACGLALAGTGKNPAAERCRAQAFKVLEALVARGWKDRVGLETDPDLDAVRGDQKFADLLKLVPMPKMVKADD